MSDLRPFSAHLREAIAVNRARAPRWAALTNGRTRLVSRLLVASEYATLPVAWHLERQARAAGSEALEALNRCFVPMGDLPPVTRAAPADAPAAVRSRRSTATATWRSAATAAWRADAPDVALAASRAMLHELAEAPGTLCMRRHLAESAARVAAVLQDTDRSRAAREVVWSVLLRHGMGFHVGDRLDDLALPLQRDGIPILAHDLPAIPLP